jgi:pantothenate kinase-related protein Tda10
MLTLCHQFHGEKSSPLESDAHEQVGLQHDAHEQAVVLCLRLEKVRKNLRAALKKRGRNEERRAQGNRYLLPLVKAYLQIIGKN